MSNRFRIVVALAIVMRGVLIIYGAYQDTHSTLKYTDIDYKVFSDAARIMSRPTPEQHAKGWLVEWLGWDMGDPYDRETYRYTPLLAALMLQNEYVHPMFGKIIFAAADILVGVLLYSLSRETAKAESLPSNDHALYWVSSIWLLNPMPANISTRGSSESVLGLMVISTLALVMRKRYSSAAVMFGLAVHCKIYPFIYGASILASMTPATPRSLSFLAPMGSISRYITVERVRFALVSFGTFSLLNLIMYSMWGYPFLEQTYVYHIIRKDHRHNFSPHFYPIYLRYLGIQYASPPMLVTSYFTIIMRSPFASFAPQMLLAVGSGFALGPKLEDLPFVWFIQTAIFVTFNKVCTSQYFMWYLWFLPLVLPRLALSLKRGVLLLSLWVGAQALWLSIAYRLEFLGEPTYLQLWGAGVLFLLANSFIIGELVLAYH